jgi:hypothetical protein
VLETLLTRPLKNAIRYEKEQERLKGWMKSESRNGRYISTGKGGASSAVTHSIKSGNGSIRRGISEKATGNAPLQSKKAVVKKSNSALMAAIQKNDRFKN